LEASEEVVAADRLSALVVADDLVRNTFKIVSTRLRCALAVFFISANHRRFSFFNMADSVLDFAGLNTWTASD
jgi:hypothetical protein